MHTPTDPTHPHLWAKTNRKRGDTQYHPLICHLIDVAMVAETMWDTTLKDGVQQWAATQLGMTVEDARRWIAFLAGIHDIGKASPSFQKEFDAAASWMDEHGISRGRLRNSDAPHGTISAIVLRSILSDEFGLRLPAAQALATAIGGHHGTFPSSPEQQRLSSAIGPPVWNQWRLDLAHSLSSVIGELEPFTIQKLDHAFAMWLAGLVTVADWVGSNSDYFQLRNDYLESPSVIDLKNYAHIARAQAGTALWDLGWVGWDAPDEPDEWDDMFSFQPRPLQQTAIDLAPTIENPSLVIVEAPMGEGKTEAALYLSDYWSAADDQQGLYVGLPTMATSNQMFTRVKEFLQTRYPNAITNLQLQHGHAALSKEFNELIERGKFRPEDMNVGDDPEGNIIAAEWFTYRKRGLLAPFGVGTIDQALLAVLQTRHVFVRLHGLAHKTLILDEVHAYETYMSTLIERLLEWCAALGTSVILLSATLPENRRLALMAAYQRGLGVEPTNQLPDQHYPRISWVSGNEIGARGFETSPEVAKTYDLTYLSEKIPDPPEPFDLGFDLKEALRDGGCVAVICNTVGRAQKMYLALKEHFDADEIDLLHARFLFGERDEREKRALQRFGKPGSKVTMADGTTVDVERPHRAILVATQVIEQSLDLDFDLMVSDFAPIDLLLQRAGRLHRHERDNRPEPLRDNAQLWIMTPDTEDGVPKFDPGTAYIYDEHVLLRTWLTLEGVTHITLPGDIEPLIESVYRDQEPPTNLTPALLDFWHKSKAKQQEKQSEEARQAEDRDLNVPSSSAPLWRLVQDAREEDSPELHAAHQALTRLAGPSVSVVCLFGNESEAYLDRQRTQPIDVQPITDLDTVRQLLLNAVTITHGGLVPLVLNQRVPSNWEKSALLRHQRLLLFDDQGRCQCDKYELQLDAERGLIIRRADNHSEISMAHLDHEERV